jgi:hypothetical protein
MNVTHDLTITSQDVLNSPIPVNEFYFVRTATASNLLRIAAQLLLCNKRLFPFLTASGQFVTALLPSFQISYYVGT